MFWFQLVVIVALLAAVGWIAVGGGGHMSEPAPDRPDLALPENGLLDRDHVDRVRFSVGVRGYRMDEVDDVLDRLAHEIDLRERRIAELEGRAPALGGEGDSLAPEYEYTSPNTAAAAAEGGDPAESPASAGMPESSGSEGGETGSAAESGADPVG